MQNMAQYRQQSNGGPTCTTNAADYVSVGIRGGSKQQQQRRFKNKRMSIGTVITFLCFVFSASAFAFLYFSGGNDSINVEDEALRNDFLTNVTRFNTPKIMFGHGSTVHGRDSRYWDGDDRRRDEDYTEEEMNKTRKDRDPIDVESLPKKLINNVQRASDHHGLYNEAGRNELRIYEEKYEASLQNAGQTGVETKSKLNVENKGIDNDDEYDDGIDSHDAHIDHNDPIYKSGIHSELPESHSLNHKADIGVGRMLANQRSSQVSSVKSHSDSTRNTSIADEQMVTSSVEKLKKHRKHHGSSTCEMKLLSSTAQLVEPLESRKFARFTLSYTQNEENPDGVNHWERRFSEHQSLREREDSFIARDQKINCGFVKGSKAYPGPGFDLAENDYKYMSQCHTAVISCIFGNSDRLRSPFTKAVSHLSRKNVCFVMFMDERTLQTLSSEGQKPDRMGYIGLWKVVVVKNLPFEDMRRVGKIPKLLSHRLFPSARYSIWLDSKLRLQRDPLLLLENFLWRKGYEYAISNHYDRHCVWEEVARNKKLNKFNHTMIDEQFHFYQADGLKRFNSSDPNKLLPSNVPEGSMIIRAHTPMSNLFSCLWFNEVDRFTPRDQLSFAYTYQKLNKKNPDKPFYLHMFKDCERRQIAKLFHHRTDEQRNIAQAASE